MLFNMNGYVKVKLNEQGYEILKQFCVEYYNTNVNSYVQRDDKGYISLPLWEMMNIYGQFGNLKDGNLPFDKYILLQYENDIVKYSIESPVNVKLTKAGIDHLEKIGEKDTKKITVLSIGGNTEFTFVELMSKFGCLLYHGNNEPPFNANITIPEKYLTMLSGGIARK